MPDPDSPGSAAEYRLARGAPGGALHVRRWDAIASARPADDTGSNVWRCGRQRRPARCAGRGLGRQRGDGGACARRQLLRRPPAFEKIVLERGDERAAHVGGTGGLRVDAAKAMSALSRDVAAYDRAWLSAHGMDWAPGVA